jgi:hypothetical protein
MERSRLLVTDAAELPPRQATGSLIMTLAKNTMTDPLSIISTIWGVVMGIAARWEKRSDHEEKTIVAVSKAFHATEKYYATLKKKKKKNDPEKEWELAALWEEASIYLRKYNIELSRRVGIKGHYWRDPSKWSELEVADARIGLDRVKDEVDRLLKNR